MMCSENIHTYVKPLVTKRIN